MFQACEVKIAKIGGAFGAQDRAGKKRQEKSHRERQKAEDRHRLQDVEQRDQNERGAPAFGGKRRVDEGEDQRGGDSAANMRKVVRKA